MILYLVLIWFSLNLCFEKGKEQLKPYESREFGKAGRFPFGYSDQDRDDFVDSLFSHVLLEFTLMKLLIHLSFKVI